MKISFLQDRMKRSGMRDTQSRRMVVAALRAMKHTASPYDIQRRIQAEGNTINSVTVYRILAALEKLELAHRHPCNGFYSLCSIPDTEGHHGFLHCNSCGTIEEFSSEKLCTVEDSIAKTANFRPSEHVSEIVGTCHLCQKS